MKHTDAELIKRTLEGDQQAFAELVEKYQEQIHALAWQKIGDFHIAQEITQDAFITAYQKLATLTHHNRFAGWLYVITSNKCNMWHRKKKPKLQSLEETDPMELEEMYYSEYVSQQREEAANQSRRAIVRKLLNKLKESERTVVTMHYLAGLTCEEIGKFLGVSPNTVKSRLHRARERLKKEEAVIQENLSSFQLPTQLTENIMKEISSLNPATPSGSKPLVPLAVSAASAILVVLLIGFGAQNLIRFQQPYNLESTSEQTVEIVDAPIVLESLVKPAVSNQVGRSDVTGKNDSTGQNPDTSLFAAAQSDDAEISTSKAQWGPTNGPYGGDIHALLVTPEGVLLAGTNQGIFRSTDLGDSWSPTNVELPDIYARYGASALAFAQKGDIIYASVPPKLYASTDTGKSWHYVPTDPQDGTISGIVIIDNRIYISTSHSGMTPYEGVWYSDDGESWTQMNDGLTDLRIREFANIGTTLVVGTEEEGAFRKKATEDSWHPINSAFSTQPPNQQQVNKVPVESGTDPSQNQQLPSVIRVDSFAVMDNLLYVGLNIGEGNGFFRDGGLFRSDDEGDSWTRITAKEMRHTIEALDVFGSTLYASTFGGGVFRSNDKGDSWIPVSKGMTNQLVIALAAVDDETVFAGTMEGGVFRTTDGGNSWVQANTGIMSTSVTDLEVLGNTIYALMSGGDRILYSANSGESWEAVEVPPKPIDFTYSQISALNGKLYVGAMRFVPNNVVGGIFQYDEQTNALIEVKTDREAYGIECMHIVGTTFYVGTQGDGVFLWNEGWDSWLNLGLEGQFVSEISLSDANIYARTWEDEIFRLKDDKKQWEPISETVARGKFAQTTWIDDKLYALSAREGLLRSVDGGNSWTQLKDGIEQVSIETVEIDGTDFYVGTALHGVFKWFHEDEKWEQLGSLTRPVQSLAVLNGYLYAGTEAGVHRIQIEK